jgi:hypothetical protein
MPDGLYCATGATAISSERLERSRLPDGQATYFIVEFIEARSGGNFKHAVSINSTIKLKRLPRLLARATKVRYTQWRSGKNLSKLANQASASQTASRSRL